MKRLKKIRTSFPGLYLIQRNSIIDHRGYFGRLFCSEELASVLGDRHIIQVNHALTLKPGTVRGLHFQYPPRAEMKLVSCLRGEVFDVAVDLRADSPSFGRCHTEILSAENSRTLLIPEGCAHGYQTLTEDCELLYLHTTPHSPEAEGGYRYDSPSLGIDWPLPPVDLSERDLHLPLWEPHLPGIDL